jgi:hypothetical protein
MKVNPTPGSEVLQFAPVTEDPTVWRSDVPPLPNPVASDIVSKNFVPLNSSSCVEKAPALLLTADKGME